VLVFLEKLCKEDGLLLPTFDISLSFLIMHLLFLSCQAVFSTIIGSSNKPRQTANPTVLLDGCYGCSSIDPKAESWLVGDDILVNLNYELSPDRLSPYVD